MAANSPAHLAVDIGASSGRVIAGRLDSGKLTLEAAHRFPNGPLRVQDSLQWNVLGLWSSILEGLAKATVANPKILSVGVDTWGVDYALIDGQNSVAGPVRHYRDARTRGMVERAQEIVPRDEIFQATGLQFMEINTLYQLLSAKLSDDPALQIADSMLMMGDFFHWLLSGNKSVELTNASTTQLLDPRTKTWSTELIDRFDLPRHLFGELVEPGTDLGPVQPSVAVATGLDGVPVIVPPTHDTASAVIAVPAEGFAPAHPDWCYISSGTWSLMGCEVPQPNTSALCSELNFTNEGGVRGSTRLLKNIGGLWIFQQIRESILRRGQQVSWDQMVQQATAATPFELLLNPDDADFIAPADMIDAVCQYAGRTGQSVPTDNAVLYRAALEGLALRYRTCLSMLESLVGNRISVVHVVGGGSMNGLLCQMTADACNRGVIAGPVEATAIGNVLTQMLGTGQLASIEEARGVVRASFETTRYEPQNPEPWNAAAERFNELL